MEKADKPKQSNIVDCQVSCTDGNGVGIVYPTPSAQAHLGDHAPGLPHGLRLQRGQRHPGGERQPGPGDPVRVRHPPQPGKGHRPGGRSDHLPV